MAAISTSEQPHMQQIDLMKLNLQQLTQLKGQLDQVRNKTQNFITAACFQFMNQF
jgi:hypothetical protein